MTHRLKHSSPERPARAAWLGRRMARARLRARLWTGGSGTAPAIALQSLPGEWLLLRIDYGDGIAPGDARLARR